MPRKTSDQDKGDGGKEIHRKEDYYQEDCNEKGRDGQKATDPERAKVGGTGRNC